MNMALLASARIFLNVGLNCFVIFDPAIVPGIKLVLFECVLRLHHRLLIYLAVPSNRDCSFTEAFRESSMALAPRRKSYPPLKESTPDYIADSHIGAAEAGRLTLPAGA